MENQNDGQHILEIATQHENSPSVPPNQTSSSTNIYRLWVSIQAIASVCQIIVCITILCWSKSHENPKPQRFTWLVGYTAGCLAMLPILYFSHRISGTMIIWLYGVEELLEVALGCFFAVWLLLGNIRIAGVSPSAPRLDMLCQVLVNSGCIVYALPAIRCCLLHRVISSILASRNSLRRAILAENTLDSSKLVPIRLDSLNALPIHKFKAKDDGSGGVLAAGTQMERAIAGEDAVCCICLGKYADNDEVRELPCRHLFHMVCVDEWLKINARCPLCQSEIGSSETRGDDA